MTTLQPARLGIGTATFVEGYGLDQSQRSGVALLRQGIEHGVRYLDTAAAYGESEAAIGELAGECRAHGVRICTKISAAELLPETVEACTRASLDRLRVQSVDTLLLHSVSRTVLGSPLVDRAFAGVRRHRLAARLGASTYGVDDALLAVNSSWCDSVQVEYSILNQSVVRAVAKHKGPAQEVIVRSVLCKGLLTTTAHSRFLAPKAAATLDGIADLARGWGMTLPALAIRFALDTPGVDVVLVGVASAGELEEALAASALPPLTQEQYAAAAEFEAGDEDWTHPERWTGGRLVS